MSISESKIRMSLVIDKSDKELLEKIAKTDDRSVNYTINKAIKEYIKKNTTGQCMDYDPPKKEPTPEPKPENPPKRRPTIDDDDYIPPFLLGEDE